MPEGDIRARVQILTGCLMPLAFGEVHRATVRVLTRNGCVVSAPRGQACCGALHAHNGDLTTARRLARRNIAAFEAAGGDAVIVNSAGCGAAMKEYGHLLSRDSRWAERAARFSTSVRDINEFLVSLPFEKPGGVVATTVTYQDSCHLAHAQGIKSAPRDILRAIPGLELIEMKRPDRCCGSAGVYSMTQPAMSLSLLNDRMDEFAATGARLIATSNPGCSAQLQAGVRTRHESGRVLHPVEMLDRSYRTG
jgi:glycolate oxidase iron-sulfur subunit